MSNGEQEAKVPEKVEIRKGETEGGRPAVLSPSKPSDSTPSEPPPDNR